MIKDDNEMYPIRLSNLQKLVDEYGSQTKLIDALDEYQSAISSMLKGKRPIGDKKARQIEEKLGKPKFWLDKVVHNQHLVKLTDDEMHLINYFRLADDAGKRNILDAAFALSDFEASLKKAI